MKFVHLNTHSHYSLLDALGSPKDIVKKAKEQGFQAVGLTDNAYLYGLMEFYKAAKDAGIKPLLGCEFFLTATARFEKTIESASQTYRLTVLAHNNEGYHNLLTLSTLASLEGYFDKPRIDFELLQKYAAGLTVLSGSKDSQLAVLLLGNDLEGAEALATQYREVFGENYYLEIQRHSQIPEYAEIEPKLLALSHQLSLPLVATHSPHYLKPADANAHDILLCIGNQTNLLDERRPRYHGDFSFVPGEDMERLFADLPEAIANTAKIAEQCSVEIKLGQYLIPVFQTPQGETSKEYLRLLCLQGLDELYPPEQKDRALKQLNYELDIVDKMGFNDYFLIVWDFINYAKSNGIMVGPGRGSAAGAIIAYTLKITELDPIEHGLVFERFLNPDRVSMPDIDIDFADHRRHEVLAYTINKYGKDCVSQVITYGTMSAKAAVRDVGRGMGYPYSEVDRIAKAVPQPVLGKHAPLQISAEKDAALSEIYKSDPRAAALLDNAMQLEGSVRHAGTHACAVIVADRPLVNFTPLQRATDGSDGIVTQYSMKYLEEIGLLKMDFLGLKNLTIIEKAIGLIEKRTGEKIDITRLPLTDEKTFQLLQRGDTTGVFQLESSGMRRYIRELKPTRFEDIVAMISLYRPGPLEWIPSYIEGKHKPETIKYLDPSFEEILKETNGIAIYQEQILLIARHFAGFSLGQADILRRAVGKKDPKALAEQKDKFIQGAIKTGHTQEHARNIFEKVVEPFAGYGFNKAHAACYAMISYRTSYLKAHYPTELMASLLTSDSDNTDKIIQEMADCEQLGVEVLPPSINESETAFSVEKEGRIRFGLAAIKGLGEGAVNLIIESRSKKGPFTSLENLVGRIPAKLVNKKTIECLAYSGALDQFGDRRTIAENYEKITEFARHQEKARQADHRQTGLFAEEESELLGTLELKPLLPLGVMEKLKKEKEYLGLFVSSTPLKGLGAYLRRKAKFVGDLTERDIDKKHHFAGLLTSIRTIITKSGAAMAYAELEDPTGKLSLVIFPKTYAELKFKIKEDQIFTVLGKLEFRRNELQLSVLEMKGMSLETMVNNAQTAGLYDPSEKSLKRSPHINFEKLAASLASAAQSKSGNQQANYRYVSITSEGISIRLPPQTSDRTLQQLKQLLSADPGERAVVVLITKDGQTTGIKTGLQISGGPDILARVEKLLG